MCCTYPAQGQMHLQRPARGYQAPEMLRHAAGGSRYRCSKPWAWAVSGVLSASMRTPRILQVHEQQALMAHLWPQWHHRYVTLKAAGSTAGVRGRHLCHEHWSLDHATEGQAAGTDALGIGTCVMLHVCKYRCPCHGP